jgi:peptide/nickel transport system substrate-binding protein
MIALMTGPVAAAPGPSMLRVGLHSDESTLTPYSYVRGDPGYYLLLFVYDTLLILDENNMPQPGLAEKYTWSADGKTLTLDLRKGVKWHDGQPFTAADVAFTFDYVLANVHNRWTGPIKIVDKMTVTNTHQLVLTLKQTSVGFLYQPMADMPILPKHIWEKVTDPKTFPGRIGTGPYKLVDYKADQYYKFEANKDYFLGKPSVDQLVMPIIKDSTAIFAALKAGEIDAVSRPLSPELVRDFQGIAQMKVVAGPVTLSQMLLMNNRIEPFNNKDFRKAVALAINQKNLMDTLFLGYATEGRSGWVHPDLPWFLPELADEVRYDLAAAKRILDSLGYVDTTNDGYRQYPDGRAMSFSILVPSDDPVRVRAAEITASDFLKALGLKVTVTVLDRATLFSRIGWGVADHDHSVPRNFELLQWGWSAPMQSWPGRMREVFHSNHASVGTANLQMSSNTALDPILDEIHVATDPAKRLELARQAQKLISADVPFVNLYHPQGIYVYNQKTYDGWVFQAGLGIFNKLSFLSGKVDSQVPQRSSTSVWLYSLMVLVAAATVFIIVRTRRQARAG